MTIAARLALCLATSALLAAPVDADYGLREPLRFFEGKTVSETRVSILFHAPFNSRSVGRGKINPDGSLTFVQMVEEQGREPFQRSWHIKQDSPGKFSGTMSEAIDKVVVEDLNGRYRFRFSVKGNVRVEEWLNPAPDGMSAAINMTLRKHGFVVGHSTGTIRKVR